MSSFAVTSVELQVAGHSLHTVADEGRTDLARLSSTVEQLVGNRWRGIAASRFGAGFDEWRAAAGDGLAALEVMADLLEANGRDYTASDGGSAATLGDAGTGL
jgi:WXG100 family type VII secretion target